MKKFYLAALVLLMGSSAASASAEETYAVWNETTSAGYASLSDAITACPENAEDFSTLILNEDVTVESRITIGSNRKIIIKSADVTDPRTITDSATKTKICFILNNSTNLKFESVKITSAFNTDGNTKISSPMFEINNSGNLEMTNCTFDHYVTTNGLIFNIKSNNALGTFNNVKFVNSCSCANSYFTSIPNSNFTFDGDCSTWVVKLNGTNSITVGSEISGPMTLLLENYARTSTQPVVKGTTDRTLFSLPNEDGYQLNANTTDNYLYVFKPAVLNTTTGVGYSTLSEAIYECPESAEEYSELVLKEDVTVTNRIAPGKRKIKVNGSDSKYAIIDGTSNICFVIENSNIVFDNITFKANGTKAKNLIECKTKGTHMELNNCVVDGFSTTNGSIISGYNESNGSFNNLTFKDCTSSNTHIFFGSNNYTLSGNCEGTTVYIEKEYHFTVTDDFSGSVSIKVADGRSNTNTVVEGTSNTSLFTLLNEGYDFIGNAEKNCIYVYKPTVVINGVYYGSFADAIKAANDDDLITLLDDQTINARMAIDKKVTIVGKTGNEVITNNVNNSLIAIVSAENVTIKNVIFTSAFNNSTTGYLENKSKTLVLENVTFRNITNSHQKGIVANNGGGAVTIKGVKFDNCTTTGGKMIFFCKDGGLTLDGYCDNLSVLIEKAGCILKAGENLTCTKQDAAGVRALEEGETGSIAITLPTKDGSLADGLTIDGKTKIVDGTSDTSLFNITNDGYRLYNYPGTNYLVLADNGLTGIDAVAADNNANAPEEYYTLQGVKVASDNLAPGLYIRRQGSQATKVLVR